MAISIQEAEEFFNQVKGKRIRLTGSGWGDDLSFEPMELNLFPTRLTGDLYSDGVFLRHDWFPVGNGFAEDEHGDRWILVWTSGYPASTTNAEMEIPEWKLWDNVSKDIRERQERIMKDLRSRRVKEESNET